MGIEPTSRAWETDHKTPRKARSTGAVSGIPSRQIRGWFQGRNVQEPSLATLQPPQTLFDKEPENEPGDR
jgi:hypothetical protein